jgi:hypothetical protein
MHAMVSIVTHFLLTSLTSLRCGLKLGVAGMFLFHFRFFLEFSLL